MTDGRLGRAARVIVRGDRVQWFETTPDGQEGRFIELVTGHVVEPLPPVEGARRTDLVWCVRADTGLLVSLERQLLVEEREGCVICESEGPHNADDRPHVMGGEE